MQKVFLSSLLFLFVSCQKGIILTTDKPKFNSVPLKESIETKGGSILQILKINDYVVEAQIFTYKADGNFPTVTNKITLSGIPYSQGGEVKYAELYFYSDDRIKFKPSFDNTKKTIYAYYPISNFDRIYSLLRQNQSDILLQYYESSMFDSKEVTFQLHGPVTIHP